MHLYSAIALGAGWWSITRPVDDIRQQKHGGCRLALNELLQQNVGCTCLTFVVPYRVATDCSRS